MSWPSSDGKCLIGLRTEPFAQGDIFALTDVLRPATNIVETCLKPRRLLGGHVLVGPNNRVTLEVDILDQGFYGSPSNTTAVNGPESASATE